MVMNTSSVSFDLELSFGIQHTLPEISVRLNDEILLQGPQSQSTTIKICRSLPTGKHRLSLEFVNKNYDEPMHMFVEIKSLKFQHLADDFSHLSQYRPVYPDHWIKEQQDQGHSLPPVIHANQLGWNGVWWVDFETPIYRWIHQRLNLGWLVS